MQFFIDRDVIVNVETETIKRELKPKFAETVNVFDSIGPTGKLVLTMGSDACR